MHIIIPTKGRPESSTIKFLEESKVQYDIVIEPQDKELYPTLPHLRKIHILPQNNQGIGYCRNFILSMMSEPFWMLDDDLQKFYWRDAGRLIPIDIKTFLEKANQHIAKLGTNRFAVVGCKNGTFAIPKQTWTLNTDVAHIVYINTPVIKNKDIQYRSDKLVFEDVTFLIDCLESGLSTYRLNTLIYFTIPSGTNHAGGVDYGANTKMNELMKFQSEFPMYVEVFGTLTKTGQPKYKIHWKRVG